MEDKKKCKFDIVAFLAVLILIAFIGCMCVAIAFGIKQQKNLLNVAYADDSEPLTDNLLRTKRLGYYSVNSATYSVGTGEFYSVPISYSKNSSYPLFYYWCQNNYSSSFSSHYVLSNNGINRFSLQYSYSGLAFPLVKSCSAGTYSFGIQCSSYTGVSSYSLKFYTYNDSLIALDSTSYSVGVSGVISCTFNAVVDFDNLYVEIIAYQNTVAMQAEIRPYSCSLVLGSYVFDSASLGTAYIDVYQDGYTAGYYTGFAPSDDDFQLDIVGNNLFEYQFNQPWDDTYSKLVRDDDTYKGWEIFTSGSALYNYDELNSLSIFKYNGSVASYNFDFYYYLDGFDSGDYTFSFNYDYGDIDAHDFKLLALTFTIPETDPVSEKTLAYISDDNNDLTLIFSYYQGRYVIRITCMLSSSANLICRYAKLETGSNFTGFVPLDYYNYGYNQGYQDGQANIFGSKNYVFLDYLSFYGSTINLSSGFVFNGINYVSGAWTEDTKSLYNYNNPNFAVIDSLDGAPSGSQVGFKYSNDRLYGDILLMMPYCDDNLRVVFQVVETGEVLITSPRDTVHWTLNTHLGNINNQANWSADQYTIHFYSATPVDIYFLPYQPLDYGNKALYLPLDTKSWKIYSTQANAALNDFDSGYLAGIEQGKEQQAEQDANLIAQAKGQGYEEGRRDALSDANDYTFMGLLGAVFDAPIKSFQGLLNFDVLGVNMQSFVLALLSLSVIIIIIKIALGGK